MEWDEPTKALIDDVAERAADKAITRTMIGFGMDVDNPLQVQADFQFLRGMRHNWNSVKSRSIFVAVGLMFTGFFTFLWRAVVASFYNGTGN